MVKAGGSGVVAPTCKESSGADSVSYVEHPDKPRADSAFDKETTNAVNTVGVIKNSTEDCIDKTGVEHDYKTNDGVDGKVIC